MTKNTASGKAHNCHAEAKVPDNDKHTSLPHHRRSRLQVSNAPAYLGQNEYYDSKRFYSTGQQNFDYFLTYNF